MTLDAEDKAWIEKTLMRLLGTRQESSEQENMKTVFATGGVEALKKYVRRKK